MSRRLLVYQLVLRYISVNRETLLAYQIVLSIYLNVVTFIGLPNYFKMY